MTIIFFYIFLIDLSFCFNSLRNIESVICPTGNTTIQSGDITSFTISVIDSCQYQIQFSQKAKFGELKKKNEQFEYPSDPRASSTSLPDASGPIRAGST